MGPTAAEKADNSGPLNDRLVSKNWSVRANAYDELEGLLKGLKTKSKDGLICDHLDKWNLYLKDSNPGALEKALNALTIWLDKINPGLLVENQNAIIPTLVEKCIGHAKPVVKEKAIECFLLIFEVSENFD
mgnify:CR=1 FL=1